MRSRFGMSDRERAQAALHRAKVNGGAQAVRPRGNDRYLVTGRDGTSRYTVFAPSTETMFCDCAAGMHGNPYCWHRGATFLRIIADRALTAPALAA